MQETIQEQYTRTNQLLNENRAKQKVLMDEELGLVSRCAALEDLVRGDEQKQKLKEAAAKKEEKTKDKVKP